MPTILQAVRFAVFYCVFRLWRSLKAVQASVNACQWPFSFWSYMQRLLFEGQCARDKTKPTLACPDIFSRRGRKDIQDAGCNPGTMLEYKMFYARCEHVAGQTKSQRLTADSMCFGVYVQAIWFLDDSGSDNSVTQEGYRCYVFELGYRLPVATELFLREGFYGEAQNNLCLETAGADFGFVLANTGVL